MKTFPNEKASSKSGPMGQGRLVSARQWRLASQRQGPRRQRRHRGCAHHQWHILHPPCLLKLTLFHRNFNRTKVPSLERVGRISSLSLSPRSFTLSLLHSLAHSSEGRVGEALLRATKQRAGPAERTFCEILCTLSLPQRLRKLAGGAERGRGGDPGAPKSSLWAKVRSANISPTHETSIKI